MVLLNLFSHFEKIEWIFIYKPNLYIPNFSCYTRFQFVSTKGLAVIVLKQTNQLKFKGAAEILKWTFEIGNLVNKLVYLIKQFNAVTF